VPAAPTRIETDSPAHMKATSHRVYGALLTRIDRWLENGWATPEQRRAMAGWIIAGLDADDDQ